MLTYNPPARWNSQSMDLPSRPRLTRTSAIHAPWTASTSQVPAGSFYGFLGPNGAGKSTTIKCLTGLLRPSGGSMRILGVDPLADPVAVKRRIGVVPEDLALFDRLTAAETLDFVAQVHGLDAPTRASRAGDLLGADGPARRRQHAGRGLLARHAQEARRWPRRCCRRRGCSSSTSRSRASTPSPRGRSRICCTRSSRAAARSS